MAPSGALAKPSQAGQIPLLWQGRCPDVWSPKWGLPQKLSSRVLGGLGLCTQGDQVLVPRKGLVTLVRPGFLLP